MRKSQAWKAVERLAAKALGGTRNSRGANFLESMCDVEHPLFVIECKYRKQLPRLLRLGLAQAEAYNTKKIPLLVLKARAQHGAFVVLKLSDFEDLLGKISGGPHALATVPSSVLPD